MPSPATRSSRLNNSKQAEENEDDVANKKTKTDSVTSKTPTTPNRSSARRSSSNKSPRSSQESIDSSPVKTTRSRRNANQDDSLESEKKVTTEVPKEKAIENEVLPPNKPGRSKISTLDISLNKHKDMDKDVKKSDTGLKSSSAPSTLTPNSTPNIRRSSRAPVPSSRFKDMEMVLTPNSQKTKRALSTSSPTGTDSDSVTEPSPKRVRKNSIKPIGASQDSSEKECPHPSPQQAKGAASSDSQSSQISNDTSEKEIVEAPKDLISEEPAVIVQDDSLVPDETSKNVQDTKLKEESVITVQSLSGGDLINEDTEANPTAMEVPEVNLVVEASTNENFKDSADIITTEEVISQKDEQKSNISDQNVLVSSEVSFGTTEDAVQPISQEVSVEEVGLSCQDNGLIVEETVHTFMDEKDVVIQNTGIVSHLESMEEARIQAEKNVELSLDKDTSAALSSGLMLKGQEVTLEERDGKMVAIVKIPGTLSSIPNTPPQSDVGQSSDDSSFLLSSNSSKSLLNVGASSQKSRHGYILNKKSGKQPIITVGEKDNNTFNITLEPTTMSSLLKAQTAESSTKPSQKSLFGRVIKQDAGTAKANTGLSSIVQSAPSSTTSLVIKNTGTNPKISLLPQTIKATNPKDCKPYSLLSSPSELLQKLKGGNENKKTVGTVVQEQVATSTLSPSPKKVVIITHPSKPGGQVEKSIEPTVLKEEELPIVDGENVDSNEQAASVTDTVVITSESSVIAPDSELKPEEAVCAEEKPVEDLIMEVVEETTSVSNTMDVEHIVRANSLVDDEGVEQQEKAEASTSETLGESSTELKIQNKDAQDYTTVEFTEDKELLQVESVDEFSQAAAECDGDITSDLLISQEVDKATGEETVITSSAQTEGEIIVKQELEAEDGVSKEDRSDDQAAKGKSDAQGAKTQKIKLVDNGVVYELQIVSDGETRSLQVQDGGIQLEGLNEEGGVVVKQEPIEEDGSTSTDGLGKSTLGTQTVYATKRGRPKASGDKEDTDAPVHKLATIVQEGGQKKHFYYVSVVPGKTMDGKYRRSVEHMLPGCVVTENGEYLCKECDYRTDKKANFYKHRRLHTGSKPHICQVCKYQARTSSNLKRHMGIHDDIREFKCTQCSLSFRQKIHLERHIKYRHEEKRVKCPMCDYVCANEQPDLKMHIKRKHTQESGKVFTCPQCNIEVGSKRDLKQHLKFHKDGPELKLFCKECSFVTDCKSRLQRHLVVHSNIKPYHCGVCDYKATQKEHVVRHLRSQHKIEVNKPKRPWKKQVKQEGGTTVGNSRGDFTCGDKIFACNHCSMRFAKLINLYKHLHTQHTDIMPAETESNYYCVVCEFSTSSKKNLLIHMRRHNMTDQTPPTHVYSCVLCRYVNPRRRNLFQHMRKKHNIDISTQVDIAGMTAEEEAAVRQDGGDKISDFIQTEPGIFTQASTEEIATTSTFESDGSSQVIKDNLAGVANMIKIEDLTRVAASGDVKDSSTSLVIENGDGTQLIQAASLMQHKAADAIEGLQALAGQAGLIVDEEGTPIETKSSIVIEQSEVGDATLADGSSIILSADQAIVEEQVATIEESASEQIQHIVESVEAVEAEADAGAGLTSLELTEEQLSSLHHGDIVQMEGQVYMVELAQDPDSPDKQLLSFLPINQE